MIELHHDELEFLFPQVHRHAKVSIEFQRTLRIPDDDSDYPLPPGLGNFPLRHVDDFAERVPRQWMRRGGVMLPMYQSEAMWLNFDSPFITDRDTSYPCAIKVATGKINAVTGKAWNEGLHDDPQDYLIVPEQPWLDGYCVEKGIIRQFVAMPLGEGYTVEEQITGEAEHGGVQIVVYPMKRDVFERRFRRVRMRSRTDLMEALYCEAPAPEMGLGAGGRMRQEVYDDPYGLSDWEQTAGSRCFVHIANSIAWRAITGKAPPTMPPTASQYTDAGLPWFEYYGDAPAREGVETLANVKTVYQIGNEKGKSPLPENESTDPMNVKVLRTGLAKDQVREGTF